MDSFTIAVVVFAGCLAGTVVGLGLQSVLPKSHLATQSREIVWLGTGLVATMAALVLGLLVGEAKASFDAQSDGFHELAANVMLLDTALGHYGPKADPARASLRRLVASTIESIWPADASQSRGLADARISQEGEAFYDALRNLNPQTEMEKSTQASALTMAIELGRTRWILSQTSEESLPRPFLVVLVFWLFVLFISFSLFAPRNLTVLFILLICALSVASATYLMEDLDRPFEGLLRLSSDPLRQSLDRIGH